MSNFLRKVISKNRKTFIVPLPSSLIKKGNKIGLEENKFNSKFNIRIKKYLELLDEAIHLKTQEKKLENDLLRVNELENIAKYSHGELNGIVDEKNEAEEDNYSLLALKSLLLLNNKKLLNYWQLVLNILSSEEESFLIKFEKLTNFTNIYFTEEIKTAFTSEDLMKVEILKEKYIRFKEGTDKGESTVIDNRTIFSLSELFPNVSTGKYKLYKIQLDLDLYKKIKNKTKKLDTSIEQLIMLLIEYSSFFDIIIEKNRLGSKAKESYLHKSRKRIIDEAESSIDIIRKVRPSIAVKKYSLFEIYKENRLRTIQLAAFISQLSAAVFKWEDYLKKITYLKENSDEPKLKTLLLNIDIFLKQIKTLGAFNLENDEIS